MPKRLPAHPPQNKVQEMTFELTKTFRFESAHRLPNLPAEHKCARLHGHSFHCDISVSGPLDPLLGWVIDYADIKAAVKPLIEQLDHYYLNEIAGLQNPTSEVLAQWLWQRIVPNLPGLTSVTIRETCTTACTYRGSTPLSAEV